LLCSNTVLDGIAEVEEHEITILLVINADQVLIEIGFCRGQEFSVILNALSQLLWVFSVFENSFVRSLEGDDDLGNDFQVSDHLDLVVVHGTAIENPAVRAAVRSLKSISHQVNNDIIRKWFVLLETSGQILSQLSITFASDCVLEHLGDLNVHELVFLSDFDCLLFRA